MEEYIKVIVDSDILIKAYRGDSIKIKNLKLLKKSYCISLLSAIELIASAKNPKKFAELNRVIKVYKILNEEISKRAFQIYKSYFLSHHPKLFDCFIASSALENKILIYTDNKKDFNYIDGIKFYNEK